MRTTAEEAAARRRRGRRADLVGAPPFIREGEASAKRAGPGLLDAWDLVAVARGMHVAGESHISSEHVSVSSTRNG